MKTTIALVLFYLVINAVPQRSRAEDARPDELSVTTAEINQIEFSTGSGTLSFSVAGHNYYLVGHSVNGGPYDLSVAENLAILNELRHATKVSLRMRPPAEAQKSTELLAIIFSYDSLK